MATNIEEILVAKLRALPVEKQQEVLEFIEKLAGQVKPDTSAECDSRSLPIWEVIQDIIKEVPPEAWNDLPTDGSINVDHYLYGAPKRTK